MINQFQNNKTIFETKPVGLGFENTEIQRFDSFASFKICFNGKLLVSFLQFFPKGKAHLSNTTAQLYPGAAPMYATLEDVLLQTAAVTDAAAAGIRGVSPCRGCGSGVLRYSHHQQNQVRHPRRVKAPQTDPY